MLDKRSLEILNRIVVKPVGELLEHEIFFLRARRSYLNGKQMRKFESIFEDKVKEMNKKEDDVSYKELQKKASELGITPVVGVSKDELTRLIDETLASK